MGVRRVFAAVVAALAVAAGAGAHNSHVVALEDVTWADPRVRNLHRIARCETGGKPSQKGRPDWRHHNSVYTGALGFAHSTVDTAKVASANSGYCFKCAGWRADGHRSGSKISLVADAILSHDS